MSPLLVGVGYLVGMEIAALMLAGGLLGYFVLIPLIHVFGGHNIIFPGTVPIDTMGTEDIRATYVRYIGAGGVAFGGLIGVVKSLPDVFKSMRQSLSVMDRAKSRYGTATDAVDKDWEHGAIVFGGGALGFLVGSFALEFPWTIGPQSWSFALRLFAGLAAHLLGGGGLGASLGSVLFFFVAKGAVRMGRGLLRTEHDIPLPIVAVGILAVFFMLWLVPAFGLNFLEAAVVVLFCFFFVAVSARMVGLIGSTNQPVSGMTITALLALTLLFVFFGHDPKTVKTAAIMGGAVVCIAISLSSDLSQDMKTAALVGATPWKVQMTHIMGTLVSAVRSGFILLLLYWAYGFGAPTLRHPHPLPAPQADLMASLVRGATGGNLPWAMLLAGAGIGLVCELCGVSSLALAIGLYLPITNWPMMMVGGVLAWFVAKKKGGKAKTPEGQDAGSLFASGLIAGDALMGITLAMLTVVGWNSRIVLRNPDMGSPIFEPILSTALYAGLCFWLYRYANRAGND
ncbi:MAG: OPT/YSL family transporter [Elusimicrobiota bacterium]